MCTLAALFTRHKPARRNPGPSSRLRPQQGLVFLHSSALSSSSLLLFSHFRLSSPAASSGYSPCVVSPIFAFSSAFSFYCFPDPLFYLLLLSLVSFSLTSLFVQAPVWVLRLGRRPRSSYLRLSPLRFSLGLSSWAQRLTVFPRATMSDSGDDVPLAKSNGHAGGELLFGDGSQPGPSVSPSLHLRLFCALRSSELSSCSLLHLVLFFFFYRGHWRRFVCWPLLTVTNLRPCPPCGYDERISGRENGGRGHEWSRGSGGLHSIWSGAGQGYW